jgi:hypothetical protein
MSRERREAPFLNSETPEYERFVEPHRLRFVEPTRCHFSKGGPGSPELPGEDGQRAAQ